MDCLFQKTESVEGRICKGNVLLMGIVCAGCVDVMKNRKCGGMAWNEPEWGENGFDS